MFRYVNKCVSLEKRGKTLRHSNFSFVAEMFPQERLEVYLHKHDSGVYLFPCAAPAQVVLLVQSPLGLRTEQGLKWDLSV